MLRASCPSRKELLAFTLGEITRHAQSDLADHLDACSKCQATLQEFEAKGDSLVQLVTRLAREPDPWGSMSHDEMCRKGVERFLAAGHEEDHEASDAEETEHSSLTLPMTIGQYELIEEIGRGGMGVVYRARHLRLRKFVALKLLTESRLTEPGSVDRFHREMETVGRLEHPNVVRATDAGDADGLQYLVMELIDGQSISDRIKNGPPFSNEEACNLVRQVATGLHYAHEHGVVHRDLKPSNILLAPEGTARIADFGLAAREELPDRLSFAGTPAYMSPEQARGEGHRVDRRSDIFSLGTVFYEILVGQRPFSGATTQELCGQITSADPMPPGACDENIPNEIDRICLKALAKHASQRYATAGQMADDLTQWLDRHDGTIGSRNSESAIAGHFVPKGLRHYDAADADFFLDLLPGPKDREGLPDSLRFWKGRIEETSGGPAFGVGVLCGPSGSGKSSLLHAGLLPRLADHVTPIRVVATAGNTESVLVSKLRAFSTELPSDLDLPEVVAGLRRDLAVSESGKVLIVIDQFEQWFHGHPEIENTALAHALRQCDGRYIQAMLIVRDDFWLSVTRLMQALDTPLVEGENTAVVDLFERRHATRVLHALGQAHGALPLKEEELSTKQRRFLADSIEELLDNGRVSPIRLVLFAEMARGATWDRTALHRLGGMHGMGIAFLEQTFSSRSATAKHRLHECAARAILGELSAGHGSQIRQRTCSRAHLLEVSGCKGRTQQFDELIDILDHRLKLITAVESANTVPDNARREADENSQFYQLTHDFLIPAVREWSAFKQRETARGRAKLRLQECAALWSDRPQSRYLPSFWEWASIRVATRRSKWSDNERRMMRRAGRRSSFWLGTMAIVLVGIFLLASHFHREMTWNRGRALTEEMVRTSPDNVNATIARILSAHDSIQYHLEQRYLSEPSEHGRLRCAMALVHLGQIEQSSLIDWLRRDQRSEFESIVAALGSADRLVCDEFVAALIDETDPHVRARLGMALMYLDDPRGADLCLKLAPDPIYRTTFINDFGTYDAWPDSLATVLATTEGSSLRAGLCEALGTIRPRRFPDRQFLQLKESLLELHSLGSDGATHSAATWTLRRWNVSVPEVDRSQHPSPGRDWFVNHCDVTMIRIPAGTFTMGRQIPSHFEEVRPSPPADAVPHKVTLTSDFWVSACEVKHGLYQQFLGDDTLDERERPVGSQPDTPLKSSHKSHPANCVSWFDALLFCNWLSRCEGRSPCYRRTGAAQPADHVKEAWDVWECDFSSNGYRLLTEAEWEYACKAISETAFSFGGFTERLSDFAVFCERGVDYVATKRPNGWGLFDMHGNVCEWCWDPRPTPSEKHKIDPHGLAGSRYRPLRGGTWYFREESQLRSAECLVHDMLNFRDANIGFRIALTATANDRLHVEQSRATAVPAKPVPGQSTRAQLLPPYILGWSDEFRFDEDDRLAEKLLTVFGTAKPETILEFADAEDGTVLANCTVAIDGRWTIRVPAVDKLPRHFITRVRDHADRESHHSKILSFDENRKGSLSF